MANTNSEVQNKSVKEKLGKFASEYNFVLIFFGILIAYLVINLGATTWNGVMNILRHSAVTGIIALGMGLVIITKGIDLSVGSMLALVGGLAVTTFNTTGSIFLTLIVALFSGIVCGFFNGILIGKAKMPPFIVTLGTMLIFRSLSQYYLKTLGQSIYSMSGKLESYDAFFSFGQALPLTVPMTGWILIAVTALIVYVSTQTKYGKSVYALGSNEKAAQLAGINVEWTQVSVYTLTGLLVGVGAFLWMAMNGAVDPATVGRSYEMYAIAAVVIGGVSMSGGKGKIAGICFGAMSYAIIDKIIASLGLDALISDAIKGSILLFAVLIQIIIPQIRGRFGKK